MSRTDEALAAALACLGRRDLTEAALRERLEKKGFSGQEAGRAAAWCREQGYVNDEAYARRLSQWRAGRGYGPARVARELEGRGIDRETARRAALANAPEGEALAAALDALLVRLHREPWDEREKKRCAAALARRGYGWEDIREALRRAPGAQTDREDGWD